MDRSKKFSKLYDELFTLFKFENKYFTKFLFTGFREKVAK